MLFRHEDPDSAGVRMSDTENEAISRSKVRRWVGAHIVPVCTISLASTHN
jgi:hypothetical protein